MPVIHQKDQGPAQFNLCWSSQLILSGGFSVVVIMISAGVSRRNRVIAITSFAGGMMKSGERSLTWRNFKEVNNVTIIEVDIRIISTNVMITDLRSDDLVFGLTRRIQSSRFPNDRDVLIVFIVFDYIYNSSVNRVQRLYPFASCT